MAFTQARAGGTTRHRAENKMSHGHVADLVKPTAWASIAGAGPFDACPHEHFFASEDAASEEHWAS